MSLVGKYFFYSFPDGDEDLYNFGEVVAVYNESFYLLKNISGDRVTNTLYNIAQMINGKEYFFLFFDTVEEMNDYVKFIESPPPSKSNENNVVKLVKED